MTLYLILIWRYDRFDREPVPLLLKNFFWGAFGAVLFAFIGSYVFSSFYRYFQTFFVSRQNFELILLAPLVEESTKGVFLFSTVANRKFDNITDGLVYGGAIGLGFGMTENFLYFLSNSSNLGTWVVIMVIRTLFSGVMHCISTGLLGAVLGYAKFRSLTIRLISVPVGLAVAMFIHMGWNFSVAALGSISIGVFFLTLCMVLFVFVFRFSLRTEKKMIFAELSEEASEGLLPSQHVSILSSPERDFPGWVNEDIRKDYIKAATVLAFRKMQMRNSFGFNKNYYEREVLIHRALVHKLLQKAGFIE